MCFIRRHSVPSLLSFRSFFFNNVTAMSVRVRLKTLIIKTFLVVFFSSFQPYTSVDVDWPSNHRAGCFISFCRQHWILSFFFLSPQTVKVHRNEMNVTGLKLFRFLTPPLSNKSTSPNVCVLLVSLLTLFSLGMTVRISRSVNYVYLSKVEEIEQELKTVFDKEVLTFRQTGGAHFSDCFAGSDEKIIHFV